MLISNTEIHSVQPISVPLLRLTIDDKEDDLDRDEVEQFRDVCDRFLAAEMIPKGR